VDRDLQFGLASIVSRLEGIREELAAHTMALITHDAMRAGVSDHDLPKVVADRYLLHVKHATEIHKTLAPMEPEPPPIGNINKISWHR